MLRSHIEQSVPQQVVPIMCGIAHSALGQAGCRSDLHHRARQGLRRSGGSAHLGRFKSVNDRLGHATGDELLQWVAGRLVSWIRGADTACRYGGDEFVILLPGVDSEKSAAKVAQKLRAHLAKSYVVAAALRGLLRLRGLAPLIRDVNTTRKTGLSLLPRIFAVNPMVRG